MSKESIPEQHISIKPPLHPKQESSLHSQVIHSFLLILASSVLISGICIVVAFMSLYTYEQSGLLIYNSIFKGLFIGGLVIVLNSLGEKDSTIDKFLIIPRTMALSAALVTSALLSNKVDTNFNNYWVGGISLITAAISSSFYLVAFGACKKMAVSKVLSDSPLARYLASEDMVFVMRRQLAVIYPFGQFLISLGYGDANMEIMTNKASTWSLLGIFITYPLSIGIAKYIAQYIAGIKDPNHINIFMFLSLVFAAVPYRMLYFDVMEYGSQIAAYLLAKYIYKIFFYCGFGAVMSTNPEGMMVKIVGHNKDFVLRFMIIMFCDIISIISMAVFAKVFYHVKGFFMTEDQANRIVGYSAIDFGVDIVLMMLTLAIWKKYQKLDGLNLFDLLKEFVMKNWLVLLLGWLVVFHVFFAVVNEMMTKMMRDMMAMMGMM